MSAKRARNLAEKALGPINLLVSNRILPIVTSRCPA